MCPQAVRRRAESSSRGRRRTGQGRPADQAPSRRGTYYAMVVEKIRKQWIFPEGSDRDLEAVVAIRIARDGKVTIDKIEKGSGTASLTGPSCRAIQKASPYPLLLPTWRSA
ncbi:MAG: TonB C-terminal domain-containing protein [Ignavibacteriales bacterium]|nr:TonB C-terminal domain-containing protein [Ignavibacteriales bacterium]